MASCRTLSAATQRLAAAGARAPSTSIASGAPRRWASAKYAHMKAYKNNWVEQNEIFRENQFHTWSINKSNVVALLLLLGVAPVTMHYLVKNEHGIRETSRGAPVTPRL